MVELPTKIPDNVVSNDEPEPEPVLFGSRKWGKDIPSNFRRQARPVVDDPNENPIVFHVNRYSDLSAGHGFESLKSVLEQIHEYLLQGDSPANNMERGIEWIANKFGSVFSQSRLAEQYRRIE